MTLAFEPLPNPASPLRRWDPRWKLAALVLATLAVALLRTLPLVMVALAGTAVLALLARLPLRWLLTRLGPVALFLSVFLVTLPFLVDGQSLARIGPVTVSWPGVRLALLLWAKGLAIVTLMLVLLATAPLDATLRAAHALHLPGLVVQLAVLTYRYLFVLAGELARLRVALRVRGYRNRTRRHSYRTIGHVAGTLLVRSYEQAERVGQAMCCRGFDGHFRSLTSFATTPADVTGFLAVVGMAAALLVMDHLRLAS